METSATIGAIGKALAEAQGTMKAAEMDGFNPFHKSRYSTLQAIMDSARPALSSVGIAIIQAASVDEAEPVLVKITTLLIHGPSGEWIRSTLAFRPTKNDVQGLGSAITYLRRFSLASLTGVVSDSEWSDDDGQAAIGKPIEKKVEKPKLTAIRKEPERQQEKTQEQVAAPKPVNNRVAMIKEIFATSAQMAQSPAEMKLMIGNILGLDRPIRESSEIPDDKIEQVLEAFRQEFLKHVSAAKEVAA